MKSLGNYEKIYLLKKRLRDTDLTQLTSNSLESLYDLMHKRNILPIKPKFSLTKKDTMIKDTTQIHNIQNISDNLTNKSKAIFEIRSAEMTKTTKMFQTKLTNNLSTINCKDDIQTINYNVYSKLNLKNPKDTKPKMHSTYSATNLGNNNFKANLDKNHSNSSFTTNSKVVSIKKEPTENSVELLEFITNPNKYKPILMKKTQDLVEKNKQNSKNISPITDDKIAKYKNDLVATREDIKLISAKKGEFLDDSFDNNNKYDNNIVENNDDFNIFANANGNDNSSNDDEDFDVFADGDSFEEGHNSIKSVNDAQYKKNLPLEDEAKCKKISIILDSNDDFINMNSNNKIINNDEINNNINALNNNIDNNIDNNVDNSISHKSKNSYNNISKMMNIDADKSLIDFKPLFNKENDMEDKNSSADYVSPKSKDFLTIKNDLKNYNNFIQESPIKYDNDFEKDKNP